MLDHMLITRNLLAFYRGSEIHNELLHDESAAFAIDRKYPESDHAPVVATFRLPRLMELGRRERDDNPDRASAPCRVALDYRHSDTLTDDCG